jgi:hypothetical protein
MTGAAGVLSEVEHTIRSPSPSYDSASLIKIKINM